MILVYFRDLFNSSPSKGPALTVSTGLMWFMTCLDREESYDIDEVFENIIAGHIIMILRL